MTALPLRPHHGLCLMHFTGKGYSEDFTSNLAFMYQKLYNSPDLLIRLVTVCDQICTSCPNCNDGICTDQEKVYTYDQRVLRLCGLHEKNILTFQEFLNHINRSILLPNLRKIVCEGCCWSDLCADISPKIL